MAFTEQEASELGQPLELCNKWQFVMNTLWSFFVAYSQKEKNVSLVNDANKILFRLKDGHDYEISVKFYNSKYLCLEIEVPGIDDFEVKIAHIDAFGKEGIIRTVSNILTYAEGVR